MGWFNQSIHKMTVNELLLTTIGEDYQRAREAQEELETRSDKASVKHLINALSSGEPKIMKVAATTLGKLKAFTAVPALMECIRRPKPYPGVHPAAEAVVMIGDNSAVDEAERLMCEMHRDMKCAGAYILGHLGSEQNIDILIRVLKLPNDDEIIHKFVCEALGNLHAESAIEVLRNLAKNGSDASKIAAIHAIGKIGLKASQDDLLGYTYDDSSGVRMAALVQLGDYYLSDGIAYALERLLNDGDKSIRDVATYYLGLTGKE